MIVILTHSLSCFIQHDDAILPLTITHNTMTLQDADPEDLVFVTNATSAVNAVVSSMQLTSLDTVLCLDISYGACIKALSHKSQNVVLVHCNVVRGKVSVEDQLHEYLVSALNAHPNTKLVMVDYVLSVPGIILPLDKVLRECRARNIKTLVDAAHGVGMMALSMKKIDCDFLTSNCHKWLCTEKGTAFLWVHKHSQSIIHPNVISHGYPFGLQAEFVFNGTDDITKFLSIETAINIFRDIGPEAIRERNHKMVVQAAEYLKNLWKTSILGTPDQTPFMANIQIPMGSFGEKKYRSDLVDGPMKLHFDLRNYDKGGKYKSIEVPIFTFGPVPSERLLYCRISCHMYTEMDEVEALGQAVLDLVNTDVGVHAA